MINLYMIYIKPNLNKLKISKTRHYEESILFFIVNYFHVILLTKVYIANNQLFRNATYLSLFRPINFDLIIRFLFFN